MSRFHYRCSQDGSWSFVLDQGRNPSSSMVLCCSWFSRGRGPPSFQVTAIGLFDIPMSNQKNVFVQVHTRPPWGAYWGGQVARYLAALGAHLDILTVVGALRTFSLPRPNSGTNAMFEIKLSSHFHALGTRVLWVGHVACILTLHQVLGVRLIAMSANFSWS